MRLLTHNMLTCNIKNVKNGYPLGIEVVTKEEQKTDFNKDFILNIIPTLDWSALKLAAKQMGAGALPDKITDNLLEDDNFLLSLHHVLFEVTLVEGNLICPETGRKFTVKNSIPQMLLNEDEV